MVVFACGVIHKHVSVMKYMGDIKTFYLNIMNYGRKNVFPFKRNAEYFGVWCRSPFVIGTIKRVFAWQWKFMVALLCPNNSHIVSRTDIPCRKYQACYQSHIFAYCETSPLFFSARKKKKKTENIRRNRDPLTWTFSFLPLLETHILRWEQHVLFRSRHVFILHEICRQDREDSY